MLAYIPKDDGYTERGYIAAVAGLHPAVRFEFRPMVHAERAAANAGIMVDNLAKASAVQCAAISKALRSWDIEGLELRQTDMLRPALVEKLYGIVSGMAASDPDPEDIETSRDAADIYLATMDGNGRIPGLIREERDRGN